MSDKVTLRSLAQELGVAPATVMRALSDHPNVSLELRRRIITLAQQRNYKLPERNRHLVAIVIPNYQFEGYVSLLLPPILQELADNGYHGEIICLPDLNVMQEHIFDGCISLDWTTRLEKRWIGSYSLPLVVVNNAFSPDKNTHEVRSNDKEGMLFGLNYLYDRGRRRIAFLTPSMTSNTQAMNRFSTFCAFCRKRHLYNSPVYEVGSEHLDDNLQELVNKIVYQKVDAIFSLCETYGPKLIFQITKQGIRIPQDLAIITLENHLVSPYMNPPLTTLEQDFETLGRQSVRQLIRQIKGESCRKRVLIPYIFHERESC